MKKFEVILGVLLVGCAPTVAVAQKTVTLPAKGIHDSVGMGLGMIVPDKKWLPTRQQCLYAMKDLPASSILIREVAFQPKVPHYAAFEASVVSLTLDLSVGPLLPRKRSLTFALNHGKVATRVFTGRIQLPIITGSQKRDWHFRIPFQKPFVANKKNGPSLVMDFCTSSVITKMAGRWALFQGREDIGTGKFQGVGYNCNFQKTNFFWQTFPGAIYVGSKTEWRAYPLLANQMGFLTLGDAGWGSNWGALALPIDLKPLGAPGCTWGVRPLLSLPFLVDGAGLAIVTGIRFPNDPRLANLTLYTQGAYAHPKANPLGWLFLPSLEWRIGSGEDHNASAIASYTYNSIPPGPVSNHWMLGDPAPYCRVIYY